MEFCPTCRNLLQYESFSADRSHSHTRFSCYVCDDLTNKRRIIKRQLKKKVAKIEETFKLGQPGCWSVIGNDLWAEEIFKRLPKKSLGRNRCVCKGWNSLISSPSCIAAHHASSNPKPRKPFLLLYSFLRPRGASCLVYHQYPQPPLPLFFPFLFQDADMYMTSELNYGIVDVINGVVCLQYSISSSFDSAILWNPAIRRYVALPFLPAEEEKKFKKKNRALGLRARLSLDLHATHFQPSAIGFGYQASKNDFKVVRVWIPSSSSSSSGAIYKRVRYEVFSSEQGLWREAKTETRKCKQRGDVYDATSQVFRHAFVTALSGECPF